MGYGHCQHGLGHSWQVGPNSSAISIHLCWPSVDCVEMDLEAVSRFGGQEGVINEGYLLWDREAKRGTCVSHICHHWFRVSRCGFYLCYFEQVN